MRSNDSNPGNSDLKFFCTNSAWFTPITTILFPLKVQKTLPPEMFHGLKISPKCVCVCGWGSIPAANANESQRSSCRSPSLIRVGRGREREEQKGGKGRERERGGGGVDKGRGRRGKWGREEPQTKSMAILPWREAAVYLLEAREKKDQERRVWFFGKGREPPPCGVRSEAGPAAIGYCFLAFFILSVTYPISIIFNKLHFH